MQGSIIQPEEVDLTEYYGRHIIKTQRRLPGTKEQKTMEIELTSEHEPKAVMISNEQIELIRKTIAKDATHDELELFFYDCKRRGVHPLDKLIHFTKRGGKYVPITGIDFMRQRAHASGECMGISDAEFEGDPGDNGFKAVVTVRRGTVNGVADYTATARWSEYCPEEKQAHMWRKMPHVMLSKCAEALALRKGFSAELSGLYAKEEMDQAETVVAPQRRTQPQRAQMQQDPSVPCAPPFGQDAGRPLTELSTENLKWYANSLSESLDDPTKARFKDKNTTALHSIIEELDKRKVEKTEPEVDQAPLDVEMSESERGG